jgi:hypothetical protein
MSDLKQVKTQIKQQQNSQLTKMNFKSEADIEFLETLRDYMKQRADLEFQHAKVT